jgi:predicted 3-demethylubiquinone-9 3-methyltransferase (glyoxalase superfamily)
MAYVQGFVLPVPADKKEAYRKAAADFSPIAKEFGAVRQVEAWGDDVPDGKLTDFKGARTRSASGTTRTPRRPPASTPRPSPTAGSTAVHRAPADYPSGKAGRRADRAVHRRGIPCLGLNGGPAFKQTEAFSFQIATDDQAETDRYWNAIVGNGGQESACGWCKDRWGLSWQITPRVLTEAMAGGRRGGQARLRRDDGRCARSTSPRSRRRGAAEW